MHFIYFVDNFSNYRVEALKLPIFDYFCPQNFNQFVVSVQQASDLIVLFIAFSRIGPLYNAKAFSLSSCCTLFCDSMICSSLCFLLGVLFYFQMM